MSVQVCRRRESAAFLSTYVGAQGELLVDTTNNRVQVHDGATPGGAPAAKLSEVVTNTRTAVADAAYTALSTDRTIAVTSLTAARTVTLPAASAYAAGTQLLVFDESGACSATSVISIARAGTDTINGATSAAITTAYGYLAFQSNGVGRWTIVDQAAATAAAGASRTQVADASYAATVGDRLIGYTSLTAARTVTLSAASAYPVGMRLLVVDESGSASATNTITLARSGSDTINGGTSAVISTAYGYIAVQSNGAAKWTITDQVGAAASNPAVTTPRGYLSGATLANNATNPATQLDVTQGVATADDNTIAISLASTLTKTLGPWAIGSGSGGLDTGTAMANTWYHVFLIQRTDTNVVDVLLSTSATSPTLPANYTKKRRIGSVLTTGTATNFTSFVQTGDDFVLNPPVQNANNLAIPTTATLRGVTVPPGVKVKARLRGWMNATTGGNLNIFSPDEGANAPQSPNGNITAVIGGAGVVGFGMIDVMSNLSQQVYIVGSSTSNTYNLVTAGWIDTRGK